MGYQAVRPASGFVTGDTDAAPQSASFHIRDRYGQLKNKAPHFMKHLINEI